jgi:hypothetical protein
LIPTGTIPTPKHNNRNKKVPTIPTLMPTPTIPTTCVNCGYILKQSRALNFNVENFVIRMVGEGEMQTTS